MKCCANFDSIDPTRAETEGDRAICIWCLEIKRNTSQEWHLRLGRRVVFCFRRFTARLLRASAVATRLGLRLQLLLADLFCLCLEDMLHQSTLVLELVTLDLRVQGVVPTPRVKS